MYQRLSCLPACTQPCCAPSFGYFVQPAYLPTYPCPTAYPCTRPCNYPYPYRYHDYW